MKRVLGSAVLFMVISVVTVTHGAPVRRIHEIQRPLYNIPVFVRAGESFGIELELDGKTPAGASLVLSGEKGEMKLALAPTENDPSVFEALVPVDAVEALYDLTVYFSDGSIDSQPHAVKIIREFKNEFDFIHITDIHFNTGKYEKGDPNDIRIRLLRDISLFKPEFVIFTGDLALSPANYDLDYKYQYEKFLQNVDAPFFTVPGNHDLDYLKTDTAEFDGIDYWQATYGPLYMSFDYGSIHCLFMNTHDWPDPIRKLPGVKGDSVGVGRTAVIRAEQWEWVKKDVKEAAKRQKSILAFTHIPVEFLQGGAKLSGEFEKIDGPSASQFISFISKFHISHVFVGHVHFNSERKLGASSLEVVTKAAGMDTSKTKDPHWGFRIVHVKDGKIVGYDFHDVGFGDLK